MHQHTSTSTWNCVGDHATASLGLSVTTCQPLSQRSTSELSVSLCLSLSTDRETERQTLHRDKCSTRTSHGGESGTIKLLKPSVGIPTPFGRWGTRLWIGCIHECGVSNDGIVTWQHGRQHIRRARTVLTGEARTTIPLQRRGGNSANSWCGATERRCIIMIRSIARGRVVDGHGSGCLCRAGRPSITAHCNWLRPFLVALVIAFW